MWNYVGIIRNEKTLIKAMNKLMELNWVYDINDSNEMLIETHHMLQVAKTITQAAINRKESRGAHFRSDFPKENNQLKKDLNHTHS